MPRNARTTRRSSAARGPPTVRPTPVPPAMPTDAAYLPTYVPPLPTAHAICRRCGRIMRVALPHEEVPTLQSFLDRRPDGWTIEGMSFSFTGLCPKCRVGHSQ